MPPDWGNDALLLQYGVVPRSGVWSRTEYETRELGLAIHGDISSRDCQCPLSTVHCPQYRVLGVRRLRTGRVFIGTQPAT